MLIPVALPVTNHPAIDDETVRERFRDGTYVQTGLATDGTEYDEWLKGHDRLVALKAYKELFDQLQSAADMRTTLNALKKAIDEEGTLK